MGHQRKPDPMCGVHIKAPVIATDGLGGCPVNKRPRPDLGGQFVRPPETRALSPLEKYSQNG